MQSNENAADKSRVFVVHGRNEELRKSMFDFLRSVGLKPIEWSQAIQMTGETSPFIGDILDAAFQQAQAVVVLLSGDDEARLCPEFHSEKMPDYEKNLTPQARPNVLFEAGLALGRFPKRTIVVEVGDLRPFSDIAGRHTIRLNNSSRTRQDLAQRLSLAGCQVDLSGTDWHQSGNFDTNKLSEQVNASAKEENSYSSSKKTIGNKLDDTQQQILIYLSGFPKKSEGSKFDDLKQKFPVHREKLHFLIEKFLSTELVTVKYPSRFDDEEYDLIQYIKLTDAGWKFILEKNII